MSLLVIALCVSLDAFALCVCKGLAVGRVRRRHVLVAGAWLSGAQVAATLLGALLGGGVAPWLKQAGAWVSCGLMTLVGLNMIREAREDEAQDASFAPKTMLPLALADSMDALAVGVSLGIQGARIVPAALVVGAMTFLMAAMGLVLGNRVGERFSAKAATVGGALLILMGVLGLVEALAG